MTKERKQQVQYLLAQWLEGKASPRQEGLLFQLVGEEKNDAEWEEILEELMLAEPDWENYIRPDWKGVIEQILTESEVPVIPMGKKRWWPRVAAAAAILLALSTGSYFLFFNKTGKPTEIVKTTISNDIKAPVSNRAMITLANGRKVYLDSMASGPLASQGNVKLVKLADGQIAYTGSERETVYNTLMNPRGSKVISLTLSDGSKVWLNSESTLKYPISFSGNERKVEITGEAYFEITHDASKAFIVSKGETTINVLGTHFNVKAYDDEAEIKVTLLEGSVKIIHGSSSGLLKPGQQAQIRNEVRIANDVDLGEVMAWKNGRFQFEGAGLADVMKQISRWYDVEIVFEKKIGEKHFTGGISRKVEASKVFQMLEATEAIHFRIEVKKVLVLP